MQIIVYNEFGEDMKFVDVIKVFEELKNILLEKKQAIIKKDMEKLAEMSRPYGVTMTMENGVAVCRW